MRRWLLHPLTAVVVVLFAALVVLAVLPIFVHRTAAAQDSSVEEARTVGQRIAINVTSYDYTNIDAQFATVVGELTGSALTNFDADKAQIKTYLTNNKVATTTTVDSDAVVPGATATTVSTMVALTQNQTVAGKPQSVTSLLIRMTLVKAHGVWLAQSIGNVSSSG